MNLLKRVVIWVVIYYSLLSVHVVKAEALENDKLDLSYYSLKLLYKDKFDTPLSLVEEKELFTGERRARKPQEVLWVLEGKGCAWTSDDSLHVSNKPCHSENSNSNHVVLWNTQVFPENFLLEFEFSPQDSTKGLAIIFFSALGRNGGGIFNLDQPRREGVFKNYHSGKIDAYHTSYFATHWKTLKPRHKSHLRKNHGFHLVATGDENIWNQSAGPYKIRLLKFGGKIQLETRGKIALVWQDPNKALGKGHIGLRTMAHTGLAHYSNLRVWEILPKKSDAK